MATEKPHADEFIIHDNDRDDGWTGRQRWDAWYDSYNERFLVQRDIDVQDEFFGHVATPPLHDEPELQRVAGTSAARFKPGTYEPVLEEEG